MDNTELRILAAAQSAAKMGEPEVALLIGGVRVLVLAQSDCAPDSATKLSNDLRPARRPYAFSRN